MYKKDGELTHGKLIVQPIVRCVDDTQPNGFKPNSWIKNGSLYVVERIVGDAFDQDKMNFVVCGAEGKRITPLPEVPAIKSERFEGTGWKIFLN